MTRALAAACAVLVLAACRGERERPRAHAVAVEGFVFRPAELAAAPGDTVVFTNADAVPHTATADDGAWDSGEILAGGTWRLVVPADGVVSYKCAYHPTMTGRLVARE